jgi:hypothetical protein
MNGGTKDHIIQQVQPNVMMKQTRTRQAVQAQLNLHNYMQKVCADLRCQILFVPPAWASEQPEQYFMSRVDVTCPVLLNTVCTRPLLQTELTQVHQTCFAAGIFPADFELFQQTDGRVAMLDFDKFGEWHPDGTVSFRWKHFQRRLSLDEVHEYLTALLGKTLRGVNEIKP